MASLRSLHLVESLQVHALKLCRGSQLNLPFLMKELRPHCCLQKCNNLQKVFGNEHLLFGIQ